MTAPVMLRIAAHHYHNFFATLFTDEVRRLSKGRIRIEFIPGTGDDDPADASVRFAKQVRDGRYDLGVVDARTWDELGVGSLQPLQAPLLITDQSQYRAVLASPLADRMLAGLQSQHVVGLSLMMSELQHPVGDLRAIDLARGLPRQAHRALPVSRVNDAVISALGATPVHLDLRADRAEPRASRDRRAGDAGVRQAQRLAHRQRDPLRDGAHGLRQRAALRQAV